nr:hypothetical protein [Pirellulaceae bacterium]
ATALAASELGLMKSRGADAGCTVRGAAQGGLVDEYFPIAAASLPAIRCVDLRSAGATEQLLARISHQPRWSGGPGGPPARPGVG